MEKEIISKEELQSVLPPSQKIRITDDIMEHLNSVIIDDKYRESYRDNLLSYSNVLFSGKYKVVHYLDAVRYVTFKLLGMTNVNAYRHTFPDRYNRLLAENTSKEMINSFAGSYNSNKLVAAVYEQTIIPTYILNADVHQKAINVLADLMVNAKSEKVRADSASSLLTHLKKPESAKIELDIGFKQDGTLDELRKATQQLVEQQKRMLEEKVINAKDVAESKIIEGEYV